MKIEKIYFKNENQRIEGILHLPKKQTKSLVILVHGFTGTEDGPDGIFIELAEKLASKGFAVLRYNFRYTTSDLSEFQKMTIKGEVSDLKLIIDKISKKYDKIGIVGESLGAGISILSYDDRIKCLVLWYPAVFLRETEFKERFLTEEALRGLRKKGFLTGKKRNGKEYKVSENFVNELKTINLMPKIKEVSSPTLLIHGYYDITVPFNHSERLLSILKEPKKLIKIDADHGWHEKNSETYDAKVQKQVIDFTIEWFKTWLK